ncbi:MAG TPA: class I tRNA ligase family protein [Patescibacteria group bacterium]|nr:class I tRNA ligase family protein [Patescibacteria group bacterium]
MKKVTYNFNQLESKWQTWWDRKLLNSTNIEAAKKPYYNLMMFPYPSAEGLHVGNMYAFTGSDVYGRFKRMQGYDVFEPIGLDGFGIHSENYALKIGRHPMDHAKITEKNYYGQLHRIGAMFDWSRTVETYDIDYYRWTQWLFVQMFKHGLAYRSKAEVNWCPSCKTVLADEQVIDGKCERCGNIVEKRSLEQWFFRITAYAGKLLENVAGSAQGGVNLDWSEKVRIAQKNWIGKKEGINITYPVVDEQGKSVGEVICFTTRPDTNFGATFVVMAPEHPFVNQLLSVIEKNKRAAITKYINAAYNKSESNRIAEGRKKTGAETGLYCINQLTGQKMPLYISDFVVMGFGTGAVVGVPGHDLRDFEFATAFHLPIIRVVKGVDGDMSSITKSAQVQEEEGVMMNSGFLDGLNIHKAIDAMMDYLEKNGWGKRIVTYHLRDWLISRQRYWGPPIPMIFCKECAKNGKSWFTTDEAASLGVSFTAHSSSSKSNNQSARSEKSVTVLEKTRLAAASEMAGWYPVPDDKLPVVLPRIDDYKPGNDGVAPLAKHKEFYETTCPGCKAKAVRETDVSDTFLDSSWYFLRYPSVNKKIENRRSKVDRENVSSIFNPLSSQLPWDLKVTRRWLPVDMYTGGAEHSVLHLMYSRFVTMALKDWGLVDFEEPFTRFYAHGLVIKDGAKMSKSKGNVVNPDEYIASYGADSLRLYLMFMGPFDQGGDFRDTAMEGMSRWVGRIWRLWEAIATNNSDCSDKVKSALQKLIQKVGDDLEKRRYNTAIASMMEFTNLVADEEGQIGKNEFKQLVLLLAPFAPHVAEELWFLLSGKKESEYSAKDSVHVQLWPAFDLTKVKEERITLVVQVNGKVRDTISLSQKDGQDKAHVEALVHASERVKRHIEGKRVVKTIFISGKLMNLVVV